MVNSDNSFSIDASGFTSSLANSTVKFSNGKLETEKETRVDNKKIRFINIVSIELIDGTVYTREKSNESFSYAGVATWSPNMLIGYVAT